MPIASLRQRSSTSNANAHHSANQNMGWVMAVSNLERTNMRDALAVWPLKYARNNPRALRLLGHPKQLGSDPN